MVAAQFGSNEILRSLYDKYNAKLEQNHFDTLGRGIFTTSKDEYTRFIVLSMALKKQGQMKTTNRD